MTEGDRPEGVRGTLTFRNVHFAYPSRPEYMVSERNVVIWEHPHSQLNWAELVSPVWCDHVRHTCTNSGCLAAEPVVGRIFLGPQCLCLEKLQRVVCVKEVPTLDELSREGGHTSWRMKPDCTAYCLNLFVPNWWNIIVWHQNTEECPWKFGMKVIVGKVWLPCVSKMNRFSLLHHDSWTLIHTLVGQIAQPLLRLLWRYHDKATQISYKWLIKC